MFFLLFSVTLFIPLLSLFSLLFLCGFPFFHHQKIISITHRLSVPVNSMSDLEIYNRTLYQIRLSIDNLLATIISLSIIIAADKSVSSLITSCYISHIILLVGTFVISIFCQFETVLSLNLFCRMNISSINFLFYKITYHMILKLRLSFYIHSIRIFNNFIGCIMLYTNQN